MNNLPYLVAPIGCAVMMAVCMAMMARGVRRDGHAGHGDASQHDEVAALRAEVAQLRAEQTEPSTRVVG